MDVEYIFGDYLSDVCAQLMKSNYEVDAEGISFKHPPQDEISHNAS